MIKCLIGEEKKLIDKFIEKITNENDYEVIKYSYSDESVSQIINELSYSNFFGMKKLVIINNSDFLSKKEDKKIEKVILNATEDIDIILIYDGKVSDKNQIVCYTKEKKQFFEFPKLTKYNIETQIREDFELDGYQIDNFTIKEILKISGSDYSVISKEIEKLKYYKLNDKKIKQEDVVNIVSRNNEDVIFKFVDAINEKNTKKILEYYDILLSEGSDPIMFVSMLANNFRLLLQIKLLLEDGKRMPEIEKILSVNKYRLDIMTKKSYHFEKEDLIESLNDLFDLEYELKSKNEDKNNLVLLFLLSKYGK